MQDLRNKCISEEDKNENGIKFVEVGRTKEVGCVQIKHRKQKQLTNGKG